MSKIVSFKNPVSRTDKSFDDVSLVSTPRYEREWCLIHLATRWIECKSTGQRKRLYEWLRVAWYDENRWERGTVFTLLTKAGFNAGIAGSLIFQERQDAAPCFMRQGFLMLEKSEKRKLAKHFSCTEWQNCWWALLGEFSELGGCPVIIPPEPDKNIRRRSNSSAVHIPLWMILEWFYPRGL